MKITLVNERAGTAHSHEFEVDLTDARRELLDLVDLATIDPDTRLEITVKVLSDEPND